MLVDLNQVKDDIFSRLSIKDKKYAWNQFFPNPNTTIVGQNEYNLPMPTASLTGMKRLLRVDVKYTSSDDYISCWVYNSNPLSTDLSLYTDTSRPIVIQRDWSIFLYPAPTEAVSWGLKLEWAYLPLDLTLATTSEQIKLGREYHDVLISGLNMWNFGDKQLLDKKQLAEADYERGVKRILSEWAMDIGEWVIESTPDLSDLE